MPLNPCGPPLPPIVDLIVVGRSQARPNSKRMSVAKSCPNMVVQAESMPWHGCWMMWPVISGGAAMTLQRRQGGHLRRPGPGAMWDGRWFVQGSTAIPSLLFNPLCIYLLFFCLIHTILLFFSFPVSPPTSLAAYHLFEASAVRPASGCCARRTAGRRRGRTGPWPTIW